MATVVLIFVVLCLLQVNGHRHRREHGRSYRCTEAEAVFQWEHFDVLDPGLCRNSYVWQLAQLALPEAEMMLDVGGNMGYTAAMMFGLWSPGHNFNRKTLRSSILHDTTKSEVIEVSQPNTACSDGNEDDKALFCVGEQRKPDDKCFSRHNLHVISFDGDLNHVRSQRATIYRAFPFLQPGYDGPMHLDSDAKPTWEYIHAAVTGSKVKGTNTVGYFEQQGNEGSRLTMTKSSKHKSIQVPLVTIDEFLEGRHIHQVDILKIDAEGEDRNIIEGASFSLRHRGISLLSAECDNCTSPAWMEVWHKLDVAFGFDCYVAGQIELMYKLNNCFNTSLYSFHRQARPACFNSSALPLCRHWAYDAPRVHGNVYCVHRDRAAVLNGLLDAMSVYRFAGSSRGNLVKDRFLGRRGMRFVPPAMATVKGSSPNQKDMSPVARDIQIPADDQKTLTMAYGRGGDGVMTFESAMRLCGCGI